jgi:oxygen-dependent protoporphyrinogen oxidase
MPQYTIGHAARLDELDAALLDVPGLHLTGAAYRGVGLAGCVAQAKKLSQQLTAVAVAADPVTEGADR